MKLATRKSSNPNHRNGDLIVVSKDLAKAKSAEGIAPSLLQALEQWAEVEPKLQKIYAALNDGSEEGFRFDPSQCIAPLPNAPGFYDGSAFLSHVVRARKSRGDEMPESAKKTPLMYQGVSDNLLAHNAPLELMDASYGGDFEGEFAVITSDVPRGTSEHDLGKHFALFCLFNDVTYREIVKTEIQTKFGFLQSKPNSAFAPIAVTPDELGELWDGKRFLGNISVKLNGETFGEPNGSEMHFTFPQLVAHACRTRPLSAGSIIGTGTISNEDKAKGFACLTEKRFQEILDTGAPITPWLKPGDRVQIEVLQNGQSVFGLLDQEVVL